MKEPDHVVQMNKEQALELCDKSTGEMAEALHLAYDDLVLRNRRKVSILIEITK